jgi:chromosomal replication initiation ATPase DnaA
MRRKDRRGKYIWPRQVAAYFLRGITENGTHLWSLNEIASNVGLDTHSTVLHSIKVVNNMCDTDPVKKKSVTELNEILDYVTFSSGLNKIYKRK